MGFGIRVRGYGIWGLRVGDCRLAIAGGRLIVGRICPRLGLVLASQPRIRGSGFGFPVIIVILVSATPIGFPIPELRIPHPGVVLNP